MKKTLVEWAVIASLVLFLPVMTFARNIGDAFTAVYTCLNSSGSPVTGQSITLKIEKASNGDFFDFNDSTFKNGSWTNKSVTLSEDATEHKYFYLWTPPGTETSPEQYLFIYDNANTTYLDHQVKSVQYQAIGNSTFAGGAVASVTGNVGGNVNGSVASVTGNLGGNVNGSVGSVTSGIPTAAAIRDEMDTNSTKLGDILTNTTGMKSTVDTNLDEKVSTRSAFNSTADPVWLNQTKVE